MKPPKRKRQPGQLLCAFAILLVGILYGSNAVLTLRRNYPFRLTHDGYLVTDSPWTGLILSILLIALSVVLFAGSKGAAEKQDDRDTPTI